MKNKLLTIILIIFILLACSCAGTFTVTFCGGEGANLIMGESVLTVKNAEEIIPPLFIKKGYDFIGWDTDLSGINTDCNVNALWKAKEYTLTLVFGEESKDIKVTFDKEIGELITPQKAGYVFSFFKIEGRVIDEHTLWDIDGDATAVAVFVPEGEWTDNK